MRSKQKKIIGQIKLEIPAGKATPAPPVGSTLGQRGVNIMSFCQQFNEASKDYQPGIPLPVIIFVYEDKSFSFIIKTPPVSFLIRDALKLKKGATAPGKEIIAEITREQMVKIAEVKQRDLELPIDSIVPMIS